MPPNVEVDDLIQSGMIGLLDAAKHYSANKGANFETYAGIRIRGAMLDEVRKSDWTPRSVHRNMREMADVVRKIENAKGQDATPTDIAEALGVSIEEYHKLVQDAASCRLFSFDQMGSSEDESSPADHARDERPGPFDHIEECGIPRCAGAAINGLPEREKLVLSLYYDEDMNLREIGEVLEVSESRVCQIHGQALVRLRARLCGVAGARLNHGHPKHHRHRAGLIAIIGGAILKGSSAGALVGSAAFVIVVVGTLAASLVQTPMATFMRAWRIVSWVFKPPSANPAAMIEKIVEWSNIARKQGLLGLESAVEQEQDEFLKKGLQSLVDGGEPEAIRSSMEIELDTMEHFDTQAAKVFESMGVYSPTLGIIGAVMGLMAVMQNLNDPSKLGHGIAAAFVATIYGIAFANLLFLPMGNKLKAVIHGQIAGAHHGDRGPHRHCAGREPAQHRIEAPGLFPPLA